VDIDVPSAVELFTTLRYINLHLSTYLLTFTGHIGHSPITGQLREYP